MPMYSPLAMSYRQMLNKGFDDLDHLVPRSLSRRRRRCRCPGRVWPRLPRYTHPPSSPFSQSLLTLCLGLPPVASPVDRGSLELLRLEEA